MAFAFGLVGAILPDLAAAWTRLGDRTIIRLIAITLLLVTSTALADHYYDLGFAEGLRGSLTNGS